jgi:hypothetical protein
MAGVDITLAVGDQLRVIELPLNAGTPWYLASMMTGVCQLPFGLSNPKADFSPPSPVRPWRMAKPGDRSVCPRVLRLKGRPTAVLEYIVYTLLNSSQHKPLYEMAHCT